MGVRRTEKQKRLLYTPQRLLVHHVNYFTELEARVAWVMARHPSTRNNDTELVLLYWMNTAGLTKIDLVSPDLSRLTNPYDIIRSRKNIQNKLGIFCPTNPETASQREAKEDAAKTFFGVRQGADKGSA